MNHRRVAPCYRAAQVRTRRGGRDCTQNCTPLGWFFGRMAAHDVEAMALSVILLVAIGLDRNLIAREAPGDLDSRLILDLKLIVEDVPC